MRFGNDPTDERGTGHAHRRGPERPGWRGPLFLDPHTRQHLRQRHPHAHGFDFSQTISYEWEPTSGADPLNGAEARFGSAGGATGQSPVVFDLPAFGSTGFDAQLTLGIAGAGTILTFGAPKPASHHRVVNVPGGTATVTNRLSDTAANQINFQLDALDSGGAVTESLIGFFERDYHLDIRRDDPYRASLCCAEYPRKRRQKSQRKPSNTSPYGRSLLGSA